MSSGVYGPARREVKTVKRHQHPRRDICDGADTPMSGVSRWVLATGHERCRLFTFVWLFPAFSGIRPASADLPGPSRRGGPVSGPRFCRWPFCGAASSRCCCSAPHGRAADRLLWHDELFTLYASQLSLAISGERWPTASTSNRRSATSSPRRRRRSSVTAWSPRACRRSSASGWVACAWAFHPAERRPGRRDRGVADSGRHGRL